MEAVTGRLPRRPLGQEYETKSPGDKRQSARERLLSILAALSNKDSFEIFMLAASGIDATTDVLREHQFSRKRYYVRLKKLSDLGLIHKESKRYRHTILGGKVYESLVRTLAEAVSYGI
jgi:predicted transcriptional regulator